MNSFHCFNGKNAKIQHSKKKFEDLLAFLRTTNCKDELHLIYQKNLLLLKKSLKLSKETPSLEQIISYHALCFSNKSFFFILFNYKIVLGLIIDINRISKPFSKKSKFSSYG